MSVEGELVTCKLKYPRSFFHPEEGSIVIVWTESAGFSLSRGSDACLVRILELARKYLLFLSGGHEPDGECWWRTPAELPEYDLRGGIRPSQGPESE